MRSRDTGADEDSSEEEQEMTEEEFKRLAQQRAKAADKELARDGVKLRAPIPKREDEEAKARGTQFHTMHQSCAICCDV